MSTNLQKSYQTDLTDEQWAILQPLIILPDGGRPKTTDLRQVMNAIFYQLKTGCQWRLLPHTPPNTQPSRRHRPPLFSLLQTHQAV
ncbi:MAG: transposase [Planctomycetaceae bacterium]|nr:transposase [Planctomycetaceae bacterium]